MTKIIFVTCLIFISGFHNVLASELTGRISTNPDDLSNIQNNPPINSGGQAAIDKVAPVKKIVGAVILPKPGIKSTLASSTSVDLKKVKVFGIMHYPDGSLLRGRDHKIYITQGEVKKYIANLKELQKFKGQAIITAADEELAQYQTREHLDGELVRAKGSPRIFVIEQGKKQPVLTLNEFLTRYQGRDIHNLSPEEMAIY